MIDLLQVKDFWTNPRAIPCGPNCGKLAAALPRYSRRTGPDRCGRKTVRCAERRSEALP